MYRLGDNSIWLRLFLNSFGENFKSQRELEIKSLVQTIQQFQSTADAAELSGMMFEHWVKPPIFDESKLFFESCSVPIYIVSNIDRADILQAIDFHRLTPYG
jgi:2-haloacid dehalogenase/putative hydrolase of the HAD superfamily